MAGRTRSESGKKGAARFWQRFRSDVEFADAMKAAWRNQRHTPEQVSRAVRLGAAALWEKYYTNPSFKTELDNKLRASRSRGGSKSLYNLGDHGFKRRLDNAHFKVRARFIDSAGHKLRSQADVCIAELLIRFGVEFSYESRMEARGHAFYPDFKLKDGQKLVEVVGYAGDQYWNRTALKLQLLTECYPSLEIVVITTYTKIMKRKIEGTPRTVIFSPYQEAEIIRWCRGLPGFITA